MKITKQRLKEIIREELSEASEASIRADLARPAGEDRPSSNPEWDKADKILSDLVYLAQDLEDSYQRRTSGACIGNRPPTPRSR